MRENVVTHCADHVDGITKAGCGDGLVSAFAAGCGAEAGADDGLAGDRDLAGVRNEIHVDAANDDDGFAGVGHDCHCFAALTASVRAGTISMRSPTMP